MSLVFFVLLPPPLLFLLFLLLVQAPVCLLFQVARTVLLDCSLSGVGSPPDFITDWRSIAPRLMHRRVPPPPSRSLGSNHLKLLLILRFLFPFFRAGPFCKRGGGMKGATPFAAARYFVMFFRFLARRPLCWPLRPPPGIFAVSCVL